MKLKETEPLSEQDQQELDDITEKLFDLNEQLENFGKEQRNAKEQVQDAVKEQVQDAVKEQVQDAVKEKEVVVLKIQIGKRFDADTGEEINPPFKQTFTRSEWNNFKQFHKNCGYRITEVVSDPWNEAVEYVEKTK